LRTFKKEEDMTRLAWLKCKLQSKTSNRAKENESCPIRLYN
jgi:hypothetical protein